MKKTSFKSLAAPFFCAILLIGATFASACNTAAPPRQIDDSERAKMVSDVEIEKLSGGVFKLSDFQGKVLVVDFWATYCPPCVRQVPQLAELSRKYRDKGLEVVGLTSDERTDKANVMEFLKKASADYTVGYADHQLSSAFLRGTEDESGSPPIPQLFVLSRDGHIIKHLIGDDPQRGIRELEQVVSDELDAR